MSFPSDLTNWPSGISWNPEPVAGMLAITNNEVGLPAAQKEAPCPAAPQTVAAPAVMPVPSKEAAAETQLARQPSEEVVEKVAEEIDAPPKPAAKRLTLEQSLVELNRARQDGDKGESVEEVPEERELCLKRPAAKTSKTSGKTSKTAGSSEVKPKAKPKAKGKCSPKAKSQGACWPEEAFRHVSRGMEAFEAGLYPSAGPE